MAGRLFIRFVTIIASLSTLLTAVAQPQARPATLDQVKKIYVDTFTGKLGGPELRRQIIDGLSKSSELEITSDQASADAVLKGTGEIWISAYVSVNPRATANASPVYAGFLSAQVTSRDGDTLWSSLVTPGRNGSYSIQQDLANQLVKTLLASHRDTATQHSATQIAPNSTLKVAGATFPGPLYQAWFGSFRQHHPGIFITYDPIGSEAGIQLLRDGKLTFAASDVPLSQDQIASMPTPVLEFATVIGAVVPVYHLPNVGPNLRFSPEVLAAIYMGRIRRWNDPLITAINPHISLPDHEIVVIHRSDGSGTTFVWTDFLTKTIPNWKAAVGSGTTINWPTGKGAKGNDGLADAVVDTPYSIGYTELTYAIQRQLNYGIVRNAAGRFIQANLISLAAAANSALGGPGRDNSSLINATGHNAYPITSFTWLLVPQSIPDPATKSAVASFLHWMLTTGQKECSALAYVPLPKETVNRELEQLATFRSK